MADYNPKQYAAFLRACLRMKGGPCTLCCHRDRCAREKIACRDFQRYVNVKIPLRADVDRYPNAGIYEHVFTKEDREYGRM
jgi:hypothetical protein